MSASPNSPGKLSDSASSGDTECTASPEPPMQNGAKVDALYNGRFKWYPATVLCECDDGTYDVRYDDGAVERRMPRDYLRKRAVDTKGARNEEKDKDKEKEKETPATDDQAPITGGAGASASPGKAEEPEDGKDEKASADGDAEAEEIAMKRHLNNVLIIGHLEPQEKLWVDGDGNLSPHPKHMVQFLVRKIGRTGHECTLEQASESIDACIAEAEPLFSQVKDGDAILTVQRRQVLQTALMTASAGLRRLRRTYEDEGKGSAKVSIDSIMEKIDLFLQRITAVAAEQMRRPTVADHEKLKRELSVRGPLSFRDAALRNPSDGVRVHVPHLLSSSARLDSGRIRPARRGGRALAASRSPVTPERTRIKAESRVSGSMNFLASVARNRRLTRLED